jgi:hypothetical protein
MSYSSRHLTYPEDKLPAIAGIAQKIHEITASNYAGGLWRDNIIRNMTWERALEPNDWEPMWCIPEKYGAPSFSWASVDGRVH